MKKIFLETHNINNLKSGFGQFNLNLVKALAEETDFLKDHKIICNYNKNKVKKELGDSIFYKKYRQITRYPLFRVKTKFDLWHSVNQNTKIEPFLKSTPYLLTIHDVNFMEEDSGERLDFRIKQFKGKIARSNAIVYISEFAKRSTHQHFKIPNIPEYVIYNGNTFNNVNNSNKDLKTSPFSPPSNKPFIFSIGQMVEKKNFHTLIEMVKFLPDLNLILAGDIRTEYTERLKKIIIDEKLSNRVHIVGRINDDEKIYYYKNCLAFTFPSLREGFGLPVLEAMTFGKPVFLANKSSLPEIGGKHSFYWDHFDPEYMADIFTKGMHDFNTNENFYINEYIKHSKKFTWENAAKQYIEVYKSILENA
ncbi:glycosyltransferase family 4 protein [Aquimarina agarilytica]|uniref:glycosyltransferase family 4 protein n=1 Tax=Aquimarina agarilytica TaxID=1087449 RepID=UPI00028A2DFF|nr:glycosyltransferase family 1 protein [Aquimarina agarilytica]